MIAIDTNIVVRYVAGDHPQQSARSRQVVDSQAVFVSVTVLLEAEWVLRSTYGQTRVGVVRVLRAFAGLETVMIEDANVVSRAFDLAEQGMDFADALHLVRTEHCDEFVTFDRKLVRAANAAGYTSAKEA